MLLQDAVQCFGHGYKSMFGPDSFLYNFWCYYSRNIKRLRFTELTLAVWFLPVEHGLAYICAVYVLSFATLALSLYFTGKKSDVKYAAHPSGIYGLSLKNKLPSWQKNALLAIVLTNLCTYFWFMSQSAFIGVVYPFMLGEQILFPLSCFSLTILSIYLIKISQKIYDYYFIQLAWQMVSSFSIDPVQFNHDFKAYRSVVHLGRGLVECIWVASQTAVIVAIVFGLLSNAVVLTYPQFWQINAIFSCLLAFKVLHASEKVSFTYMLKKLQKLFNLQYDDDSHYLYVAYAKACKDNLHVDDLSQEAPQKNIFYQKILDCTTSCSNRPNAFVIEDSDDEDDDTFVEAPGSRSLSLHGSNNS